MSYQLWSWLLTFVGVTGFILAGRKVWWCWYINIACQGLWFVYAIVTHQYGFIVASAVYTVVFTQNAVKWTKDHKDSFRDFNFNEIAMPRNMDYEVDEEFLNPEDPLFPPKCYCSMVINRIVPHDWSQYTCPMKPIYKGDD